MILRIDSSDHGEIGTWAILLFGLQPLNSKNWQSDNPTWTKSEELISPVALMNKFNLLFLLFLHNDNLKTNSHHHSCNNSDTPGRSFQFTKYKISWSWKETRLLVWELYQKLWASQVEFLERQNLCQIGECPQCLGDLWRKYGFHSDCWSWEPVWPKRHWRQRWGSRLLPMEPPLAFWNSRSSRVQWPSLADGRMLQILHSSFQQRNHQWPSLLISNSWCYAWEIQILSRLWNPHCLQQIIFIFHPSFYDWEIFLADYWNIYSPNNCQSHPLFFFSKHWFRSRILHKLISIFNPPLLWQRKTPHQSSNAMT